MEAPEEDELNYSPYAYGIMYFAVLHLNQRCDIACPHCDAYYEEDISDFEV